MENAHLLVLVKEESVLTLVPEPVVQEQYALLIIMYRRALVLLILQEIRSHSVQK